VSLVKVGAVKDKLYAGTYVNVYSYFAHLLSDMRVIRYRRFASITLNCEIPTMWETNPRMTPKKPSRLSMGLEMVTRPTPCKLYYDDDDRGGDYYTLCFLNRAL
jgi:hypothetical protein